MPPKVALIALVVLIVVVLPFWLAIANSPQYAIYQINRSVENKDYQTFSKYVDVNEVVDNTINRTVTQAKADLNTKDCTKNAGDCIKDWAISSITPNSLSDEERAKNNELVKENITSGTYSSESFHLDNLWDDLKKAKPMMDQNGIAHITLVNDKNQKLFVQMQKESGTWRVIDVSSDPQNPYLFLK